MRALYLHWAEQHPRKYFMSVLGAFYYNVMKRARVNGCMRTTVDTHIKNKNPHLLFISCVAIGKHQANFGILFLSHQLAPLLKDN